MRRRLLLSATTALWSNSIKDLVLSASWLFFIITGLSYFFLKLLFSYIYYYALKLYETV